MATPATRALPTYRDEGGMIYAGEGNTLRPIRSLPDYQQGVSEGLYSGTPTVLTGQPDAERRLGTYTVGENSSVESLRSALQGIVSGQPTSPTATPQPTTTPAPAPAPAMNYQSEIAKRREQVGKLQQEAFTRSTEFTPEELRNLTPGQQAELRRQRVTALSGQMGNLQTAIQNLQAEEENMKSEQEKNRQQALDQFNMYAKYGILGDLDGGALSDLAAMAGIDEKAMARIAEISSAGEPPELREVGGNLYAISWNPETGSFDTTMVLGGGGGDGSTGAGVSSAYVKRSDKLRSEVLSGKLGFDEAQRLLASEYPDVPGSTHAQYLGGSVSQSPLFGVRGAAPGSKAEQLTNKLSDFSRTTVTPPARTVTNPTRDLEVDAYDDASKGATYRDLISNYPELSIDQITDIIASVEE